MKLVFTKRTLEEFRNVLLASNDRYLQLKTSRLDLLARIDDPFISTFAAEKMANPDLVWDRYYYRMRQAQKEIRRRMGGQLRL